MTQTNIETQVNETENEIVEAIATIALLDESSKLKDVIAKVNELITKLNDVKTTQRNRGPASTREMTDDDARRVMLGDLKDASHKDAGETLGLSYGQIYSARKGYTFKVIYKEMNEAKKAAQ
jgi:hypothetical protein